MGGTRKLALSDFHFYPKNQQSFGRAANSQTNRTMKKWSIFSTIIAKASSQWTANASMHFQHSGKMFYAFITSFNNKKTVSMPQEKYYRSSVITYFNIFFSSKGISSYYLFILQIEILSYIFYSNSLNRDRKNCNAWPEHLWIFVFR